MTNVFKIPDHVVLPEDQVQVNSQYTEEDEKQLDLEIKELEDKILTVSDEKAYKYMYITCRMF